MDTDIVPVFPHWSDKTANFIIFQELADSKNIFFLDESGIKISKPMLVGESFIMPQRSVINQDFVVRLAGGKTDDP